MLHNPVVMILVAALAAWFFGAAWYGVLSKPYQRALGLNPDDCKDQKMPLTPLAVCLAAELVMAFAMSGILPLGEMRVADGAMDGLMLGAAFMAASTLVNNTFQKKPPMLSVIDGAHWIIVGAIEGAVLAALS